MIYRLIISIILCAVAFTSMAQSVICGKGSNSDGDGMDFVSVIASPYNAPKTILASTFTDETGTFRMAVKSDCDSLILKALLGDNPQCMNYASAMYAKTAKERYLDLIH